MQSSWNSWTTVRPVGTTPTGRSPPNHTGKSGVLAVDGSHTLDALTRLFALVMVRNCWRPRRDSNSRTWFRKPMLYPLSYEGWINASAR